MISTSPRGLLISSTLSLSLILLLARCTHCSEVLELSWQAPTFDFQNFSLLIYDTSSTLQPELATRVITLNNKTTEKNVSDGIQPGTRYNISLYVLFGPGQNFLYDTWIEITEPTTPGNFQIASIGSHSVSLTWQLPSGNYKEFNVAVEGLLSVNTTNSTLTISDRLAANTFYNMSIRTISHEKYSKPALLSFTTNAVQVENMIINSTSTSSLSVQWSTSEISAQDTYNIHYKDITENITSQEHVEMTDGYSVELDGLLPGHIYQIITVALNSSGQHQGDTVTLTQSTVPHTPVLLNITEYSSAKNEQDRHYSVVEWRPGSLLSHQDSYMLSFVQSDVEGSPLSGIATMTANTSTPDTVYVAKQLKSGSYYLVTVAAISRGVLSSPSKSSLFLTTPKSPEEVSIVNVTATGFTVLWNAPVHSTVLNYSVNYGKLDGPLQMNTVLSASSDRVVITGLEPGAGYKVQLSTITFEGLHSQGMELQQFTKPYPPQNVAVTAFGTTHVSLSWNHPPSNSSHPQYAIFYQPEQGGSATVAEEKLIVNGSMENAMVGNALTPGQRYSFSMATKSGDVYSDSTEKIYQWLKPVCEGCKVTVDVKHTNTTTIFLNYKGSSKGVVGKYRFSLSPDGKSVTRSAAAEGDDQVHISGLSPGHSYLVKMVAVSNELASEPAQSTVWTKPRSIEKDRVSLYPDAHSITLNWTVPAGVWSAFNLQYMQDSSQHDINITRTFYTVQQLSPVTNYIFYLRVLSGPMKSEVTEVKVSTTEGLPSAVTDFRLSDPRVHTVLASWQPPTDTRGDIMGYKITYENTKSKDFGFVLFPSTATNGYIKNLAAGITYTFIIQANTSKGYGPPTSKSLTTSIGRPPLRSQSVRPSVSEGSQTQTTFQVILDKNSFSEENGDIKYYAVIVAEERPLENDGSALQLPSWQKVQPLEKWPEYQASPIEFNPFQSGWTEAQYVVGADESCVVESIELYCNGPLLADTYYRVKLRAYTNWDMFTDTAFSDAIQTSSDMTGLILAILLTLLILAAATGFMVWQRHRLTKILSCIKDPPPIEEVFHPVQPIIDSKSRPVKLHNFPEHFRLMSADSDFRFSEEYDDLKQVGRDQASTAADLPCNRPKNRFTNILPYDHSRVKLLPTDDDEGSDYINANYMPGENSPREYIVAQGPLASTRDDFWRMMWEQNCCAIVMLTRCIEKGREKCDHYWPQDSEPVFFGDIQVLMLNESKYVDWNITEFKLSVGEVSHVLRHFHFTTWPDFVVPKHPQTLIKFVRAVREKIAYNTKPIVLHCSAGVGRSGTWIALDRLLQQIIKTDVVDIYGMVHDMRKERVWMVQTEQQYICIHNCLLTVLEGKEDEEFVECGTENQAFDDDEGIAESGI